jgi:hypothetical protein
MYENAIKEEKLAIKQEDSVVKQERSEEHARLWSSYHSDPDEEEPEVIEKPSDWDIAPMRGGRQQGATQGNQLEVDSDSEEDEDEDDEIEEYEEYEEYEEEGDEDEPEDEETDEEEEMRPRKKSATRKGNTRG